MANHHHTRPFTIFWEAPRKGRLYRWRRIYRISTKMNVVFFRTCMHCIALSGLWGLYVKKGGSNFVMLLRSYLTLPKVQKYDLKFSLCWPKKAPKDALRGCILPRDHKGLKSKNNNSKIYRIAQIQTLKYS